VKASPEACLACGRPSAPDQEYCLECGSRIVPGRRLSALEQAWTRRFGRYPGDWVWASLLLLLVAAGSATAGIVTARDSRSGGRTIVATSRVVTAPPAPPAATTTRPAARARPAPAPAKPKPASPTSLTTWPARDGYTVVLASIPARGTGFADAQAKAKAALSGGLREVGVLESAKFASLHPGYYVVFTGIYGSLEEAQTAASRASSRFPNAYARQITR
jgi:hypothetical protein